MNDINDLILNLKINNEENRIAEEARRIIGAREARARRRLLINEKRKSEDESNENLNAFLERQEGIYTRKAKNKLNIEEIARLERKRKRLENEAGSSSRPARSLLTETYNRNKKLKEQLNLFPGLEESVYDIRRMQDSIDNLLKDMNKNGRPKKRSRSI